MKIDLPYLFKQNKNRIAYKNKNPHRPISMGILYILLIVINQ